MVPGGLPRNQPRATEPPPEAAPTDSAAAIWAMRAAPLPPTPVVFRYWRSPGLLCDVIALFPTLTDRGRNDCESFEHHGQHGGADYAGVIRATRPATPAEYADVKAELEAPPYSYRLDIRKRKPGRQ